MGPKGWLTCSVVTFTGSCLKSEEFSPYTLSCFISVLLLFTHVWPSPKQSLPFNTSCYNSTFLSKLACVFNMPNLPHSPSFYLHTKQHLYFIRFAHRSVKLCTSPLMICCLYPVSAVSKMSHHWIRESLHFVVCFLRGYSPASEFCVLTFQNTLSVPSS